jgi:hypothetical protein
MLLQAEQMLEMTSISLKMVILSENSCHFARFIDPGWSVPGSRQTCYNVKGTPRNSTYIGAATSLLGSTNLMYRF